MKKFFLSIVLMMLTFSIYAHALWIETNATGKKGQAQEVKIFYGEYAEFSPEKVKDWYSDVKEFELWLVSPDGQKAKLGTSAKEDHYSTTFTPDKDGVYTLQVSHSAKDLGRTTVYQFNTSAIVAVGKNEAADIKNNSNPLKFQLKSGKVNEPVTIQGFYKDAASEKMSVTVFSPKGWTRQIEGKNGVAEFVPEWKGKYMIEISRSDDEKGEHYGKEYTGIWRCATYLVEIK
ncbi:MAG: hypothetical protein KF862_01660 [Chitinophagaceae bacterium]|nr:hypothetical protein [Chitinophagaceae bacterium]